MLCCRITVTYYDEKDKSETTVLVPVGQNLLEAAHENNVDLEGEQPLAISACYSESRSPEHWHFF